ERDADGVRPRFDRRADLQACVAPHLHVLFPFRIARKPRFTVACVTGCGRSSLRSSSHGEPLQQLAADADVEPLRPYPTHQVVLILRSKTNLDEVLAVDGEVVMNGKTAARSEWQIFGLPIVLQHVQGNLVALKPGASWGKTDGEPRDLTRHG